MAVLTSTLVAGAAIASAVAGAIGTGVAMKSAHDQKKAARQANRQMQEQVDAQKKLAEKTPVYDEKKETMKAATTEAEANRKRALMDTDTVKTSALGNTGVTETKKKTLLGG